MHRSSGIGEWLRRARSDAGAESLGALRKLVGLAFALSLAGFVLEWIGDAISSPLMVGVGQWTYIAGMALVAGTAVWIGARLLLRRG